MTTESIHAFPFNIDDDNVSVRLSVLEINMKNVQQMLNKIDEEEQEHRKTHSEQTEKINSQMEALKKELKNDLSTVKLDLIRDITTLNKQIEKQNEEWNKQIEKQNETLNKISDKLDSLDRWRWMVVGFAGAIGFILAEFGKISKLFN